jgi:putative phage-type endonuclease
MTTDKDFHATRRGTLGASEVAMVMNLSPFGKAFDVYRRKKGIDERQFTSEAIERGTRQEQFVLNEFAAKHQVEIRNQQLKVVHPEPYYSWASATLDGMAFKGFTPIGPVEAKTINTALYVKPPVYYLLQVLWQCWVTGMPEGWLAVWSTKDSKFFDYHIKLEDHTELLQQAVNECSLFWHENVLKDVQPALPPKREREEMVLPNDLLDRYDTLRQQKTAIDKEQEEIKRKLMELLGSDDELHAENGQFKLSITKTPSNRLSQKKLTQAHPDLIAQYMETSYSYRVDIKRVGLAVG